MNSAKDKILALPRPVLIAGGAGLAILAVAGLAAMTGGGQAKPAQVPAPAAVAQAQPAKPATAPAQVAQAAPAAATQATPAASPQGVEYPAALPASTPMRAGVDLVASFGDEQQNQAPQLATIWSGEKNLSTLDVSTDMKETAALTAPGPTSHYRLDATGYILAKTAGEYTISAQTHCHADNCHLSVRLDDGNSPIMSGDAQQPSPWIARMTDASYVAGVYLLPGYHKLELSQDITRDYSTSKADAALLVKGPADQGLVQVQPLMPVPAKQGSAK